MFSTPSDVIVTQLRASQTLLHRMVDDLKPEEFDRPPCPGANTVAWMLGHLVRTERRILGFWGVEVPKLAEGFDDQFAPTRKPAVEQPNYGDPKTLIAEFDRHRELLISAVASANADRLNQPLANPHPLFSTLGAAAAFMALHVVMHTGQISILRRMLGYSPVV